METAAPTKDLRFAAATTNLDISLHPQLHFPLTMPIRYTIDKQRRLVLSTITGVLTYAEARAHQDKLLADGEFDPTYHQLIDSLQAEVIELSGEEIRTIATRSVFSPTSKRALVAVNPAFFGVGRMMQTYHQLAHAGTQVEVFRTVADACRWLDT